MLAARFYGGEMVRRGQAAVGDRPVIEPDLSTNQLGSWLKVIGGLDEDRVGGRRWAMTGVESAT